ncbi:MAG TPA: hypothetical protein VLF68_00645 [Candidatus Saccharimonadales bacterium]|nr:hypothetical protein [Candidatus Saccharimonadales bacterium]
MMPVILLLLIAGLVLESTVTTLPLILIILILATVTAKSQSVFALAFVFGLLLDLFAMRTIGVSSIFLLVCIWLIFLYQRKFEIRTYYFVFLSTGIASFFFLMLFSQKDIIPEVLLSSIISIAGFFIFLRVSHIKTKQQTL